MPHPGMLKVGVQGFVELSFKCSGLFEREKVRERYALVNQLS